MSFQPQVPLTGVAGWRFLERTMETQQAAFEQSPQVARDIAYFEENIASVETAADLVADRQLLKVALEAFGLGDDIDKKAFVRKILEEGTENDDAFANKLLATAYKDIADAFGFGNASGARTGEVGFAKSITDAYKTKAFEAAVGDADNDMRLAMNFTREIADMSEGEGDSWYEILSSEPLLEFFRIAFGLPPSLTSLDIDKQAEILGQKSAAIFGSDELTVFRDPENVDKITTRFLAMSQIESGAGAATGPAANALVLLQSATSGGSQGLMNLLYDF